ncbi:helix-turn-helix domain-containing protein [uncultured Methylovirgula sp.]|uniref:helix-turn-helix domain-containing protein n=1 Tax=uncultured Methylovirgula sp. TaxID=1285960 RepID=UPI002626ADB3|nr:helix-turn-helix domain-containing protein [uncultured Methylovirgula sp.]
MSTIDDTAQVARAIRQRRDELGLTIRGLAAKSGVSSSMISDIERAAKSPTVATLSALAAALGVPTAALVNGDVPQSPRIQVVRAADHLLVIDPASGMTRQSYGSTLAGSRIEFLRCVVPPSSVAGPFAPHPKGTIEHVHVASGWLRMTIGPDEVTLAAGDSCSCLADAPHRFDNSEGESEALLYVIVEPAP